MKKEIKIKRFVLIAKTIEAKPLILCEVFTSKKSMFEEQKRCIKFDKGLYHQYEYSYLILQLTTNLKSK